LLRSNPTARRMHIEEETRRHLINRDSTNELVDGPALRVDRRTLLRLGFAGSMAALVVGAIAALVRFLYQADHPMTDYVDFPLSSMPKPGELADHLIVVPGDPGTIEVKIYIVNLRPDEGLL